MSFFTDLFSGNFGNLGHDIFSDPVADVGLGIAGLGVGALALPAIAGAIPALGATDVAATAAPAVASTVGDAGALSFAGDVAAPAAGDVGGGSALSFAGSDPASQWIAALGGGTPAPALPPTTNFGPPPGVPLETPSNVVGAEFNALPTNSAIGFGTDLGGGGGVPPGLLNTTAAPSASPGVSAGPGIDAITLQAPTVPGAPTEITAPPGDTSNFFSNLGSQITKNPLSVVGLGGLGYNLFQGYQQNQALKALQGTETALATSAQQAQQQAQGAAQPLLTSGEALQQAFVSGTLPPQYQSQVNQWVQGLKAQIVQGYGSRGMPTDPTKNSALAQDLSNADAQGVTLSNQLLGQLQVAGQAMVQQANTMIAQGLSATQIAAQIPIAMQQLSIELGKNTSTAIASFAGALGGSRFGASQNIALQPGQTLTAG